MELLANKASSTLDAMHHHQEMKEPDLKKKIVDAMQKESNALYKLGTYKLPSTNYSNKLIRELESHYYPVFEK